MFSVKVCIVFRAGHSTYLYFRDNNYAVCCNVIKLQGQDQFKKNVKASVTTSIDIMQYLTVLWPENIIAEMLLRAQL